MTVVATPLFGEWKTRPVSLSKERLLEVDIIGRKLDMARRTWVSMNSLKRPIACCRPESGFLALRSAAGSAVDRESMLAG